jgi:hypothetical protein
MVPVSLSTRNRVVDSTKPRRASSVRRVRGRSLAAALLGTMMLVAFAGSDAYATGFIPSLGAASPFAVLGA